MTRLRVSVCIPTYNQPELFEDCLRSVLAQDLMESEILVGDDSDDDSIEEICKRLGDSRVLYLKNAERLGAVANWNAMIRRSQSPLIKFLHHDEKFAVPQALRRFVEALEATPEANFAFSACLVKNTRRGDVSPFRASPRQLSALRSHPLAVFFAGAIGGPSNTLFRTKNALFFDERRKWLVDIEYYFRVLSLNPRFVYLDDELIFSVNEGAHQITNQCVGNPQIELREWLEIYHSLSFLQRSHPCLLLKIKSVLTDYKIRNDESLRELGMYEQTNFHLGLILFLINLPQRWKLNAY